MSLQPELEETIHSIIEYQQHILLKKIAKDKNWDLEKMSSKSSSTKTKTSNSTKRGRGRPTKAKKTNLDTDIVYSGRDSDNEQESYNYFDGDFRVVDSWVVLLMWVVYLLVNWVAGSLYPYLLWKEESAYWDRVLFNFLEDHN